MTTATAEEAGRPRPNAVALGRRLALRVGWWPLPALVLAGLGGALLARHHGLWYDEIYTAEVAPLPLADLARAVVRGEGTIPYLRDAPPSYNAPYYAVAHVWLSVTGLSPDATGLRLLSLVSAMGGLVAATFGAARLAGRWVGLLFGLVVAANPFVVEYAAEARGYGLAMLASGLLLLSVARWLDGCPRATLHVGLATAALGLAHWFGLLLVPAVALAAVVLRRIERDATGDPDAPAPWPLLAALAAGSLPAVALVATAVANGVGGSGAEWIGDVGGHVPRLLVRSWSGGSGWLWWLSLVLAGVGLVAGRGRSRACVLAAGWLVVPVAIVWMVALVKPVYVDRYLLPALLGLALLMALGTVALRPHWLRVTAAAAVVAASVAAALHGNGLGPKEDVRSAVEAVAAGHAPGEPVVAAARWDALGLDHHARRHHPALVPDLVLPPGAVPEGAPAVWVVRREEGGVKGDDDKLAGLDADLGRRGLHLVEERRFPGRYADTLVQRWAADAPG